MTAFQRTVKYLSLALAIFLAVSIIVGVVGAIGGLVFMKNNKLLDENIETQIDGEVYDLDIDLGAARLTITVGDRYSVSTNIEGINVENDHGTLKIKQRTNRFNFSYNEIGEVVLTIPQSATFNEITLDTGAGDVRSCPLTCKYADIDLGAGEARFDALTVLENADIDTGAGKLTVSGGAIRNLDLDHGVGEADITSLLSGECSIDGGVGALVIELLGEESEYTLVLSTGIGSLRVSGMHLSGDQRLGNGRNTVKISGGVGDIRVDFSDR